MRNRIELRRDDITTVAADAIVNAANTKLKGGGGVDGAIHRAAGPRLFADCLAIGFCPTGSARITAGHRLPAPWVIHAVGPFWSGGRRGERGKLASAYRESLRLAREYALRTVAFPAISCGAYRFPLDEAAQIAIETVQAALTGTASPERVIFCCPDGRVADAFARARAALPEV